MNRTSRSLILRLPLLLVLAGALAGDASAQAPSLGFCVPAAVVPGQPVDVTFYGGNLEGTARLWTSFAATHELTPGVEGNGTQAGQVAFRITVPADTPPQIGGVRLATARGVSEVRLIMIDDLPSVAEAGGNQTTAAAQTLTLPVAVDGACEAESFDYYKIHASAGQSLTAEVVAQRLGSPLDPVLRLLDAAGNELAYSDDEPGLSADCRLRYSFAADGDYLLELRDIRYQGSGGHRYHLRLGNFPLCTAAYPLAARPGGTARVGLAGPLVEGVLPLETAVPADAPGRSLPLVARFPLGAGGALTSLVVGSSQELVEFEPNDAPEQALAVTLPAGLNGRFLVAKDRDTFQFDLKQGQRFLFSGQTRTLGSPTDLYLRVVRAADGAVLAEVDDSGPAEGVIDFAAPADGAYRLMVEDLHRRGGPEHVYRVDVQPYQPGFSLTVEAERVNAPQAGVWVAKVTSARRDYNGPITLSVEGTSLPLALSGQVIAENGNETILRATLPAELAPGALETLRIVGRARVGEVDVSAVAGNRGTLRALLAGMPNPPAALDGLLALGVGPMFGDFFKLAVDAGPVSLPQLIGVAKFKVRAERLNGFEEAIALAVEGLPAGFAAEVKPIEKGQPEAEVILRVPATAVEGDLPFRIVGSATFQEQPKQVLLEGLVLRIVRPVAVTAVPAGPLTVGASQKVKVTIARYEEAKPAVTLSWRGLPVGVTAPALLAVAEGQNELEFELTATAEAAAGRTEQVTLVAQTQVQGRTVTVESAPVALEVVRP